MSHSTRILFRADSGIEIGTGHIMRCLTLADALRERGATAVFVTREHSGHIIREIADRGHEAITLPGNTRQGYGSHAAPPSHAGWLGAPWRADAAATRAAVDELRANWLVMDHYALDSAWQQAAVPAGVSLLVLDDLADRPHYADLLVDPNAGRLESDYRGWVPEECELWIGPAHALLRADFVKCRNEALGRRATIERPSSIIISLGGIDKDNVTCTLLRELANTPRAQGMLITVVMGASAPHLEAVRAQAEELVLSVEVVSGISDMAERMTRADLCIGAAGSSALERCCLGLPSLQLVLASNQRQGARALAGYGASILVPTPDSVEGVRALSAGLDRLHNMKHYRAMARSAAALTDGAGSEALADHLLAKLNSNE